MSRWEIVEAHWRWGRSFTAMDLDRPLFNGLMHESLGSFGTRREAEQAIEQVQETPDE